MHILNVVSEMSCGFWGVACGLPDEYAGDASKEAFGRASRGRRDGRLCIAVRLLGLAIRLHSHDGYEVQAVGSEQKGSVVMESAQNSIKLEAVRICDE